MLIRIFIRSNIISGAIFKILFRSFYAEILALQGFPAGLRDSYFIRDKSGYPEFRDNQTLSLIGNRSGLAGAKSSLFYQAFRIIQEMRDATDNLYPAIAVWENVMGAFSTNDRMDFRAVLSAFSDTEVPMPPSGRWGNAGMVRGGTPDVCWRLMDAQYWAGSRRLDVYKRQINDR